MAAYIEEWRRSSGVSGLGLGGGGVVCIGCHRLGFRCNDIGARSPLAPACCRDTPLSAPRILYACAETHTQTQEGHSFSS